MLSTTRCLSLKDAKGEADAVITQYKGSDGAGRLAILRAAKAGMQLAAQSKNEAVAVQDAAMAEAQRSARFAKVMALVSAHAAIIADHCATKAARAVEDTKPKLVSACPLPSDRIACARTRGRTRAALGHSPEPPRASPPAYSAPAPPRPYARTPPQAPLRLSTRVVPGTA